MEGNELQTAMSANWKPKALIIGGIIGALAGVTAAYLFIQNVQEEGEGPPQVTVGQGVKIGVLVLGLLRSISSLGEK
jgi:hypothetical protein